MAQQITWTEICERLWGADWIAPLSEVLHVNRRTVERWRSGKVAIPDDVVKLIVEAFPPHRRISRELGDMLRQVASGGTDRQIRQQIEAYHDAYRELLGMRLRQTKLLETANPDAFAVDYENE